MKVLRRTNDNLIIHNPAGRIWLFGSFFLLISGTFIVGLAGLFNNLDNLNTWEKIAAWFISLSGFSAGIWIIYSHPGMYIEFIKSDDRLLLNKKGLLRNETSEYNLSNIKDFILIESKDSEGDPYFIPGFELQSGRQVPLTSIGSGSREIMQKQVDEIKDFLS